MGCRWVQEYRPDKRNWCQNTIRLGHTLRYLVGKLCRRTETHPEDIGRSHRCSFQGCRIALLAAYIPSLCQAGCLLGSLQRTRSTFLVDRKLHRSLDKRYLVKKRCRLGIDQTCHHRIPVHRMNRLLVDIRSQLVRPRPADTRWYLQSNSQRYRMHLLIPGRWSNYQPIGRRDSLLHYQYTALQYRRCWSMGGTPH